MDNDIKMIQENRQEDKEKIENFTRQRKDDAHDGKNGRKERRIGKENGEEIGRTYKRIRR